MAYSDGFYVQWNPSIDNVAVTGYEVVNNGREVLTLTTATNLRIADLPPSTNYTLSVRALDAAGNRSTLSTPARTGTLAPGAVPVDTISPSPVSGIRQERVTANDAELTWSPSTDNIGVVGYEIRSGGKLITRVTEPSVQLSGLNANTAYRYDITARDAAGRSGQQGTTHFTTPPHAGNGPDTQSPTQPGHVAWPETTHDSITARWGASTDDRGVKEYRVKVAGKPTVTVPAGTMTATVKGLVQDTLYSVRVTAVDHAGNESTPRSYLDKPTKVRAGSTTVQPPRARGVTAITAAGGTVHWWPSHDPNIDHYQIFRPAKGLVGTVAADGSRSYSYALNGIAAGAHSGDIIIRAVDKRGNVSTTLCMTFTALAEGDASAVIPTAEMRVGERKEITATFENHEGHPKIINVPRGAKVISTSTPGMDLTNSTRISGAPAGKTVTFVVEGVNDSTDYGIVTDASGRTIGKWYVNVSE